MTISEMSKLYSEGLIAFVRSSLQRFEKQFFGALLLGQLKYDYWHSSGR